jgi:two-component system sensor histidine kinase PilS (NtrC family)
VTSTFPKIALLLKARTGTAVNFISAGALEKVNADDPSLRGAQGLRILRLYHLYRLLLGALLVLLSFSDLDTDVLSLTHAPLFRSTSLAYLTLNILLALNLQRPRSSPQLFGLAMTDIALLSILFYAGGMHSGIGNLMVVTVAISNIFLRDRLGLLVAASASSALVYLTFHLSFSTPQAHAQLLQAGTLGTLCFAASLLVQRLARRLQASESLAQQRAVDVADLEELNNLILQRMRSGILLVDEEQRVLLANQAAHQLLGQDQLAGKTLNSQHAELSSRIQFWQHNSSLQPASLVIHADGPTLQPSFIALQRAGQRHTLILLENISQIAQQAQQLKLVALGRLSAGIAHEIRNPLGAISHAAQLLQESQQAQGPDQRLIQIIQDHSRRINLIIENILQLSRRRQAEPKMLDLKHWLNNFVGDFRSVAPPNQTLHLDTITGSVRTRMDPDQLRQVITNLVHNGLRYSARNNPQAQVWLTLLRDPHSDLPILEVLDDGPGIEREQLHHIFEPFYTTESKGTGLGLYISRELCESNQAHLHYKPHHGGGACFRIIFAHPRKLS